MTLMVGIVYRESSALLCEDQGDYYWVENGQWGFLKSVTDHFHFVDCTGTAYKDEKEKPNPWRVIIPDMSIHKEEIAKYPGDWYNPSCFFISDMAMKHHLPLSPQEQISMFGDQL